MLVADAVVNVWTGMKVGGNGPICLYTRQSGCDPAAMLAVAAR